MPILHPAQRGHLEKTVVAARDDAEKAATNALKRLAVDQDKPFEALGEADCALRVRLRAEMRRLGGLDALVAECAYEQWHRMLFARFLAENDLLIHPDTLGPVTLHDCSELAEYEGDADAWACAARYASRMLPAIFRSDDPILEVRFDALGRQTLERLLNDLPTPIFTAEDSIGWVYQFWQSKRKQEVNAAGEKIGGADISPVTQLFTEHYMVEFLLHNSLGAWWVARHPDDTLKAKLTYLRMSDDGTPAAGNFGGWPPSAADLKVLDPCCGSGHFETAAFALLREMRMREEGLSEAEAADAVLRDNLFGLELDPRCTQIAAFAVALAAWKAGGYRPLPQINIACSGLAVGDRLHEWTSLAGKDRELENTLRRLFRLFQDAPDLGSLIDPAQVAAEDGIFALDWADVGPVLARALAKEPPPRLPLRKGEGYEGLEYEGLEGEERAAPTLALPTLALPALAPPLSEGGGGEGVLESAVFGVAALGVAAAAALLTQKYHLVVTNVPYLARGKQDKTLRDFIEARHNDAKADLATAFVDRCLSFCAPSGSTALVTPQNWLFLGSYKKLRERLLAQKTWDVVAKLGENGFENVQAAGAFVALFVLTNARPPSPPPPFGKGEGPEQEPPPSLPLRKGEGSEPEGSEKEGSQKEGSQKEGFPSLSAPALPLSEGGSRRGVRFLGLDAAAPRVPSQKAELLRTGPVHLVSQAAQLDNPDARLTFDESESGTLLEQYASGVVGVQTADYAMFGRFFWELPEVTAEWELQQSTVEANVLYGGREHIIWWQDFKGELARRHEAGLAYVRGRTAWGKPGVAVSSMGTLPITVFTGELFDNNAAVILPRDPAHLPAIWAFCSSPDFHKAVRRIDQALKVTNASLVKVPFDLAHWQKVADETYPNGLPEPYSNDPTQWLFTGHPNGSTAPLQVAVARLLGYRWPQNADDDLAGHADADGIVCLPPVAGETPAAERLRALLAQAYEPPPSLPLRKGEGYEPDGEGEDASAVTPSYPTLALPTLTLPTLTPPLSEGGGGEGVSGWTPAAQDTLLADAGSAGKDLDEWLRDSFFAQHCKLFGQRPFVWHVWDGRKDGFAALVNSHCLDRAKLDKLIYTYLGGWISTQKDAVRQGIAGSDGRLVAAQTLQKKLIAIAEGEPPFDIYVRWKPLAKQAVGWDPDLNDGIRMNIRPFMAAEVLRAKPNINWNKDRGKNPDGSDRENDLHKTRAEKEAAR